MARKEKSKKKSTVSRIGRALASAVFFLFMVGLITGVAVGGFLYTSTSKVAASKEPVIDLYELKENTNQTTIVYAYDKDGNQVEYARLHGEINREWIELDTLNAAPAAVNKLTGRSYIADAYVALEDKRFYDHRGVDWRRLAGVVKNDFTQGASTITQQLIKNYTGENGVTVVRKYREIRTALNMETNFDKKTIIESYLNTLYLGRGCYGIKTGAKKYFGKEVEELNIAECAALASITKAPNTYDPMRHPEANRERQLWCMTEMLNQGMITQAQYDEAKAYKLVFTNSEDYEAKENAVPIAQQEQINNPYVDFIIETVAADLMKEHGYTRTEAIRRVYNGGLKIYSAVDIEIQEVLEDVYRRRVTFSKMTGTKENPINSAMTIMDYEGRVVAIVGQAGKKTDNRTLNRAFQSWRPPGSTIKPLSVYGPAIEKNIITWSTMLKNEAFPYAGKMWPNNVDGTQGNGAMETVQFAVQESRNTIAARVVYDKMKFKPTYEALSENFGFTKLDDVRDAGSLAGLSLGGLTNGFSTLEECAAYAVFGNGGTYYSPYCYTRVTDHKDQPVLELNQTKKTAFSEDTAKIMNEMLQTTNLSYYINGNGGNITKFKRFGKTGTTNDNKDRWFAGGTPHYVASVWFGYDIPKDLGQMTNPSAAIWTEVFNRIHKNLDTSKKFPTTKKAVTKTYCKFTGDLAGDGCTSTATGWYRTSNLPKTCAGNCAPALEIPEITFPSIGDLIPFWPQRTETATEPAVDENPTSFVVQN